MSKPPRRRRWRIVLLFAVVLLLSAGFALRWLLKPEQLGALLIDQLQQRSGLRAELDQPAQLGYWPGLRLRLVGLRLFTARGNLLFRVEQASIALPLSVLWSDLQVREIGLQQPLLDLDALQAWRNESAEAGPPTTLQIPEIGRLEIEQAQLRQGAQGWQIESLNLRDLRRGSELSLQLSLRIESSEQTVPLQLQLQGQVLSLDGGLQLRPLQLRVGADADATAAELSGGLDWQPPHRLDVELAGQWRSWPSTWPQANPELVARLQNSELRITLSGPADLSGRLQLAVQNPTFDLDAGAELTPLLDWWTAGDWTEPPPLQASATAERIEHAGLHIEGLRIESRKNDDAE